MDFQFPKPLTAAAGERQAARGCGTGAALVSVRRLCPWTPSRRRFGAALAARRVRRMWLMVLGGLAAGLAALVAMTPRRPPWASLLRTLAPPLDGSQHKGQSGRVAVLGGSPDYTGAPYYAGMAALTTGADLLYVLTAKEAALPIKSYSPELMVTAVYCAETLERHPNEERKRMVENVEHILPKLHAMVIGPGLGRNPLVMDAVAMIIGKARERRLPLVIDADGLWLVTQEPDLVKGYENCILTPNMMEFRRLCDATGAHKGNMTLEEEAVELSQQLGNITIFLKGPEDVLVQAPVVQKVSEQGSPRRSGGIGDIVAGTLGTALSWSTRRGIGEVPVITRTLDAAIAASGLVRMASRKAFKSRKRSTTAPDILVALGDAFEEVCPAEQ